MSRFYARYVPPAKTLSDETNASTQPSSSSDKRKRDEQVSQPKNKKLKTSKSATQPPTALSDQLGPHSIHPSETFSSANGNVILDKYRITETAKSGGASVQVRTKRFKGPPQQGEPEVRSEAAEEGDDPGSSNKGRPEKALRGQDGEEQDGEAQDETRAVANNHRGVDSERHGAVQLEHEAVPKRNKRGGRPERNYAGKEAEETEDAARAQKHAAVLSKFEKSKQQDQLQTKSEATPEQPTPELHGLEPIPQPEQVDIVREMPAYSILPAWQENPLLVPSETNKEFRSFGLAEVLAGNLRRKGLHQPLPIQAAVLPLLLNGPGKHAGDLCISAATGSGKTLSYALPIIAALKDLPGRKLRAVIVVPTRELVKQVQDLCEACAAGTSLKFATAVGSTSLNDEQQTLVKEEKIYDPEEYEKWQQSPIDWSNFSLAGLARKAKDEDPLDLVGYITRYRSKVDVLITTPGRLVDHLRSTPGFTLDHLAWLVVDEADRLLNESYQEWVGVVKPALESQAATQRRDQLLRHMRMTPPKRRVTKILLSATMTRDLSKLNALGLHNPKLVVLGGDKPGQNRDEAETPAPDTQDAMLPQRDDKETFHLPETLKEVAIPLPDGSEKPLFLLELVRKHIGITAPVFKAATSTSNALVDTGLRSGSTPELSSGPEESSSDEASSSTDSASETERNAGPLKDATGTEPKSKQRDQAPRALIFARSTASAERLSRLMCLLDPELAKQVSTLTRSTASSASSRRALASFRNSRISILIATDRASRGLDVPGLEHVVSYDVPNSALTYVHRVGRAARAGRGGQAWTLVEHREAAWFWREIGGKGKQPSSAKALAEPSIHRKGKLSKLQLSLEHSDLKQKYEEALRQLGQEVLAKP
ncbi:hypothetical protein A1O7_02290 [Cladophialophora yegresii CBS 114405]|uniref:ATP-dependent RNA helicase n=1 Tax=Cladophialophora yegresii CBS 114405 TaxID=1182544 RepID=W9WA56_9EURO|nr:uncharacterized protein A1O7_02290 [Cladophialophora yegresii CBS 114405]EXJ61860.1 hypothetical protein A1O7_02290 [Cladophialophora yegresii CBS 114405]